MAQRAAQLLLLGGPLTRRAVVGWLVDSRGSALRGTETLPARKREAASSSGKERFSSSSSADRLFRRLSHFTIFYARALLPRLSNDRCASFFAPQAEGDLCLAPEGRGLGNWLQSSSRMAGQFQCAFRRRGRRLIRPATRWNILCVAFLDDQRAPIGSSGRSILDREFLRLPIISDTC